ncbi:hypothetical protein Clacol_006520 [Clathrus columnatus]|uniref:Microtubule-associated protein Jupiter n=1 Tax=Clathrus columnatus TaxID=1419009 RepID=A0AAV5AHX1_9AGAM|nr:hypothetical protein Clacol_006520 [Clathrus columnatus]
MSQMSENTARGVASQRGGQKVNPETYRDSDSVQYKKSYQTVGRSGVVSDLNDEYMRHPPHNDSGPRDKGVWKKMTDTRSDPTDPQSEVPKDLENSVGVGGIGSVIGRPKKLDQQIYDMEESEV